MSHPVELKNITLVHQATTVINNFSLRVHAGEFLVLLGPSGCGKSTLLNAVAGLHPISQGNIDIGNQDVTNAEPKDRNIAMVFQSYALYPTMNVYDNLAFSLKVAGIKKADLNTRVLRVADMLQLTALLKHKPAQLSGGQRQRVAIGRALVREKPVLLCDEPLSNLDAKLRNELRLEIKRLHRQFGSTTIYVTHDQIEAMTLADRIVVINKGQIEQVGSPLEIYQRPANRFVAEFIGSPPINLIDGRLTARGAMPTFECGEFSVALPQFKGLLARDSSSSNRAVTLGVRPEALAAQHSGTAGIPGFTLELVEQTGPETLLWCQGYNHRWAVKAQPGFTAPTGSALRLQLTNPHCSLFDAVTGERLSDQNGEADNL